MKMTRIVISALLLALSLSSALYAKDDKDKQLPPGLQKQVEQGKSLPPGWQKKLAVGETLDHDIYKHGRVVATDDHGVVTIRVEDKLIRVIENSMEIVDILTSSK